LHAIERATLEHIMTATIEPEQLLREGIAAARSGDKVKTRELMQQVTELDPQNQTAWLWRANCAETAEESLDCLRNASAINPNHEATRNALPDALVRVAATCANDRAKGRRLLMEATTLAPRHEMAWLWRAGLADTPEEAIKHLRTVLSINPNNKKAQAGLAKYAQHGLSDWPCPICETRSATAQTTCPKCKCLLSVDNPALFDEQRNLDKPFVEAAAKKLYAGTREQPNANAAYYLGVAYLNMGFYDDGLKAIQAAAKMPGAQTVWSSQVEKLLRHQTQRAKHAAVAASTPPASRAKPMVLVVDDSATIRKLVSVTLNGAGYEVIEADSGNAAMDQIREHGIPGTLVLDVNMPGMDGFALCKLIRSNPDTAKTPVVFLTGKDGLLNKLRGQWVGASEYLTKPFDPQKLLHTVGKLLPTHKATGK
jgi:twitching motility two-component system response regulator PilG